MSRLSHAILMQWTVDKDSWGSSQGIDRRVCCRLSLSAIHCSNSLQRHFQYFVTSCFTILSLLLNYAAIVVLASFPPFKNKNNNQSKGSASTVFTFAAMVRKRDAGYRNLGQMALFKALDLLSGHSRELAPRPSSYKIQRKLSVFIPPTGPANWPGVEAPTDLPHLPPRAHCLTPPPSRDLDNPFVTQSPSRDDTDFDDPFVTPPPSRYGTDLDDPFEQAQSPLFRLPSGVLRLIYEEVIGNRTIHIVRRQDRLGHALCSINTLQSQEQCRETQCRGLKWPNGTYEPGLGCSDILPLLKTCRKTLVILLLLSTIC